MNHTDVPMRFVDQPLLVRLQARLSAANCRTLVDSIEASAPVAAHSTQEFRGNDRVIRDDAGLASELFDLVRHELPERVGSLQLVGLNERLRLYRYRPGQKFSPHMDHWYQPTSTRISLFTFLLYLNEGFAGGETRFMEQFEDAVVPSTGSAIVFQHKVRHEGCEVVRGVKYALRSDVMYESPSPIRRTFAERAGAV